MKGDFTRTVKDFFIQYSIVFLLFIGIVGICLFDTSLLSVRNVRNVISDVAPLLLFCVGIAISLYAGHFDISFFAQASLAGIVVASFMQRLDVSERFFADFEPLSPFLVIPLVVVVFYAIGALYGFIVKTSKIPSWILSIGFALFFTGLSYIYVSSYDYTGLRIADFTQQFISFGVGYMGKTPVYSVPYSIIISILVLVAVWFYTHFLHIEVKKNSKIEVPRLQAIFVFGISSALFSLAGIMMGARTTYVSPSVDVFYIAKPVVICLLAGFSIWGGKGNLIAVIVATLFYTAFVYCMTFIGLNKYYELILQGLLLIAALCLDLHIRKDKSENIAEIQETDSIL